MSSEADATASAAAAAAASSESSSTNDNMEGRAKRPAPEDTEEDTAKRQKVPLPPQPAPVFLFATSTDVQARRGASRDDWCRTQCLTLREMLGMGDYSDDSMSMGPIDFIFISNYIVNFEFLLDEVPELLSLPRACVVYGAKEGSENAWRQASTSADGSCSVDFVCRNPADPPATATNPLAHKIPYGVHHSKFFLVGFSSGLLRVVIHTANLRHSDVNNKAQGAYIQNFGRKTPNNTTTTTDFEDSLVQYIQSYKYNKKFRWDDSNTNAAVVTIAEQLRKYDFSTALAVLVPSIPGYHKINNNQNLLGHLKVRQQLARIRQEKQKGEKQQPIGPIVCQFSSMGSLTNKYLHRLAYSMNVARAKGVDDGNTSEDDEQKPINLQLVYPTSDEICNSLEGYRGGNSVPGTLKNVSKDFLRPFYRKWSASKSFLSSLALTRADSEAPTNPLWKGNNVPHIKTYFQLSSNNDDTDGGAMEWFVLTSHNLSKAAWGDVQNSTKHKEKRLFIRHWELGVLLSPDQLGAQRLVPWSPAAEKQKDVVTVPLPYRHKPLPYADADKPWAVDQRYVRLDIFGRRAASDA
ncbi:Tyrosyl-DNA phosphodiesterase 1 [Seminavis robusta]|uniref:Tyrosyl-DNA phosphodiesterase 1 n=1 Tax=Seminavis robusta TaxID=568900 RepID=A0A9N8HU72_9STRA|nr:Tyrosyl-DNA phosphodiesterase 1 [Seminavis robusta]|eukprot:Sro2008_g310650.1 Tyrosyl-DNA phosphodiesterase 1 (578) ;mRNA; f:13868-15826